PARASPSSHPRFDAPRREGALQFAHDAVELFQSAIDVQYRRFGIRRQKQGEPMLADLEVRLMVRVRARHVDPWQVDSHVQHSIRLFLLPRGQVVNQAIAVQSAEPPWPERRGCRREGGYGGQRNANAIVVFTVSPSMTVSCV